MLPFMSKTTAYNPAKDIPDLGGKIILITGGLRIEALTPGRF